MTANAPEFTGITPYLHYDDVATMIDWLNRMFGFMERGRWLDGQGIVRNAEIFAGTMEMWLDGDPEYWKKKGRRPEEWIGVWVNDVDAMFARVKAAGVTAEPPQVTDPEGYTWGFMQRSAYVARFEK